MIHYYYITQFMSDSSDWNDGIENEDWWTPQILKNKLEIDIRAGVQGLNIPALQKYYDKHDDVFIFCYNYMVLDSVNILHMSIMLNKKINIEILGKKFEFEFDYETLDKSIKKFFKEHFLEIQKVYKEKYPLILNLLELERLVRESLKENLLPETVNSMIRALSNI